MELVATQFFLYPRCFNSRILKQNLGIKSYSFVLSTDYDQMHWSCQYLHSEFDYNKHVSFLVWYIVYFPDGPSVNLTKSEDSRTEMTITCMVDSNPPSQISWLKDGVKLDTENLSLVVSEHKNKQILSLVDLNEETFGNYSCIAENKLGKDQMNAKIAGM